MFTVGKFHRFIHIFTNYEGAKMSNNFLQANLFSLFLIKKQLQQTLILPSKWRILGLSGTYERKKGYLVDFQMYFYVFLDGHV